MVPKGTLARPKDTVGGCWGPLSPQAIKAAWLGKGPKIINQERERGGEQRQVIILEKYGRL